MFTTNCIVELADLIPRGATTKRTIDVEKLKPLEPPGGKTAEAAAGELAKSVEAYNAVVKELGIKVKKRGIYARDGLSDFIKGIKDGTATFVKQHSTNRYIGTVGLVSCSAPVYVHGSNVVLGHFFPNDPGQASGIGPGGLTYVSMDEQLGRFDTAMKSKHLQGNENGGAWILIHPVNSNGESLYWEGHGVVAAWAKQLWGKAPLYVPYKLSATEALQYAKQGKVYYGNTKVYDSSTPSIWETFKSILGAGS
jgi:hypothetical protein